MILDEYVDVIINSQNTKFYEDKGYIIPTRNGRRGENTYAMGETMKVKPEDLSRHSKIRINVICDVCGEKNQTPYFSYYNSINNHGFYCCNNCKGKKISIVINEFSNEKRSEIIEKMCATYKEKHGDYSFGHAPDSIKKKERTMLERLGVPHPMKSLEIQEKAKNTNILKYGVPYVGLVPEFIEKKNQTCLEKYGTINPAQSEEVKRKVRKTIYEKYGTYNLSSVPEIKNKLALSLAGPNGRQCSTQQRYLNNVYGGELNYPFMYYNLDIAISNEKLDIEYDGSGHKMSVTYGEITEEEFLKRTIYRANRLKHNGWRIMRIVSLKDNLPSDAILLEMLNFARQFFADNPDRSWIEFDIDNNIYRNALHKDGEPYDFGPLRKIKQEDLETKALS